MATQKLYLKALILMMFVLSGCGSSRFFDDSLSKDTTRQGPIVIEQVKERASVGQVSQSPLPPLETENAAMAGTMGGQLREETQQMSYENADLSMGEYQPPVSASILSPSHVAGVWKAQIGEAKCQIATPQTKFGKGYRAGPLHCPGAFEAINSWSVQGAQLVFYDRSGNDIAQLYSVDKTYFEGRTKSGLRIVLTR